VNELTLIFEAPVEVALGIYQIVDLFQILIEGLVVGLLVHCLSSRKPKYYLLYFSLTTLNVR
jgi:hypothetical protein